MRVIRQSPIVALAPGAAPLRAQAPSTERLSVRCNPGTSCNRREDVRDRRGGS